MIYFNKNFCITLKFSNKFWYFVQKYLNNKRAKLALVLSITSFAFTDQYTFDMSHQRLIVYIIYKIR